MIVLDTNVISELMRPRPDHNVMAWTSAQVRSRLYTTYVNQAEVLYGIEAMPQGKKRAALEAAAKAMFVNVFDRRILPLGAAAAACYPAIVVTRRQAGTPIEGFDALIAAIALAAGASVATRDTGDFAGCGLTLINPWSGP